MTFISPYWLVASGVMLAGSVLFLLLSPEPLSGKWNGLLKLAGLAAITVALSQPEWTIPQRKTAVVAMVDTSGSMRNLDLQRESELVSQLQSARGANWLRVVPFSAGTRPLTHEETSGPLHLLRTSGPDGNATSLEAALTGGTFALPPNLQPRIALISDGNENEGSSARAIEELQSLHIPVDTFPVGASASPHFNMEAVSLPRRVYGGEQIPIDLAIRSPHPTQAEVELFAEGKSLGRSSVSLSTGRNQVRVHARINFFGATVLSGRIAAADLGEIGFQQSLTLRPARVLYLSQDPSGADAHLLDTLAQGGFQVSREPAALAGQLSRFQLIILNNLDLASIPLSAKSKLEEYVKSGGGLLLIGGERQVYKEDRKMDALDRALPADLAPPKSPEGTCVILIIDKSSSMEGRKIELARLSAIGVVDHLKPTDFIGVLIFDNSFQWAVPVRRAEDKTLIRRLISGITPDGGTQIAPALTEAYRRISNAKSTFKHIVLLTDGISEEGDSIDLAKEAAGHSVTISTVGLGQDVNRSYLEKVASTSGGKSYFLNEPSGLEQILLKDVKDFSGSTAVEQSFLPLAAHNAEVLSGVPIEAAPPLHGYARFTAKPTADTVLQIDPQAKDPLYVRWQFGLGRAAVFTSDAKSRWAEKWIAWPGFDSFWLNVSRDLLAHDIGPESEAVFEDSNNEIKVTYRVPDRSNAAPPPPIFVIGTAGFRHALALREAAAGVFTGSVAIGNARGLFRIRPASDSADFPELGLYRGDYEHEQHGINERTLRQIADLTGGRFNPPITSVFDETGLALYSKVRLWPFFLALAIALSIAELIARKWRAVKTRFLRAA